MSVATNLQSVFLLAAINPNLARLMGIYWVDTFFTPREGKIKAPEPDLRYDYKIIGNGLGRFGLLLDLGSPCPEPRLLDPLTAKQLAGLRWDDFGQPLSRAAWPGRSLPGTDSPKRRRRSQYSMT